MCHMCRGACWWGQVCMEGRSHSECSQWVCVSRRPLMSDMCVQEFAAGGGGSDLVTGYVIKRSGYLVHEWKVLSPHVSVQHFVEDVLKHGVMGCTEIYTSCKNDIYRDVGIGDASALLGIACPSLTWHCSHPLQMTHSGRVCRCAGSSYGEALQCCATSTWRRQTCCGSASHTRASPPGKSQ